jgi:GNAT superfamily N-acetyltransferase
VIRRCRPDETAAILAIVNAAAERYRGAIPPDCWHEPYMSREELDREIAAGVEFWGCEVNGSLVGIMGIQPVRDVTLIRHAYVSPAHQGKGIGGKLLGHLRALTKRPILIGTWKDASWAIGFYEAHGFERVAQGRKAQLLRTYWNIPDRQAEVSVVLRETTAGP